MIQGQTWESNQIKLMQKDRTMLQDENLGFEIKET